MKEIVIGFVVFGGILFLGFMIGQFATIDAVEYWLERECDHIEAATDSLWDLAHDGLTENDIDIAIEANKLKGRFEATKRLRKFYKGLVPLGVIPYLWRNK